MNLKFDLAAVAMKFLKGHISVLTVLLITAIYTNLEATPLIDDHFTSNPVTNGDWTAFRIFNDITGMVRTVTHSDSHVTFDINNTSSDILPTSGIGILNNTSPINPATDFLGGVSITMTFAGENNKQLRLGLTQNSNDPGSIGDQVCVVVRNVSNGVLCNAYTGNRIGTGVFLTSDVIVGDSSVNISSGDQVRVTFNATTISMSFYDIESNQEYVVYSNEPLGVDLTNTWDTANAYVIAYLFATDASGGDSTSVDLDRIVVDVIPEPAFDIRALDITLPLALEEGQTCEEKYSEVMDQMLACGLNTALINLGHTNACFIGLLNMGAGNPDPLESCSKSEISQMIAISHAKGIEPIIEIKMLGKMYPVLEGLAATMPGLFRQLPDGSYSNVINLAYQAPNGDDVYDAVLFPLVDELLSMYGSQPAQYFFLGIDEFQVDELAISAAALGISPMELFADYLVRMTEHLSSQGVTPIITGDMLLSTRLADINHGVTGFTADSRFSYINSYNSAFQSTNGVDLLTSMNYIPSTTRAKIIVADWHYKVLPEIGYPSVDYFQTMGFMDVWGAVWWSLDNIQTFSQYALERQCGGMILETFGSLQQTSLATLAEAQIRNAGTYFIDPGYQADSDYLEFIIHDSQGQGGSPDLELPIFLPLSTTTVQIDVPLPLGYVPTQAKLEVWANLSEKNGIARDNNIVRDAMITVPLQYDAAASSLTGEVTLPRLSGDPDPTIYDFNLLVLSPDRRYIVQNLARQSLLLGTIPQTACSNVTGTADSDWLYLDVPGAMQSGDLYLPGGSVPTMLYNRPLAAPTYMDLMTYVKVPPLLWQNLETQGMEWSVTFKPVMPLSTDAKTIVSWGNFKEGVRLFVRGDTQEILLIFSRGGRNDRLILKRPLTSPNQWTTAKITVSAPDGNGNRVVSLQLDEDAAVSGILDYPLVPTMAPIVIGDEFRLDYPSDLFRNAAVQSLRSDGQVSQIRISPPSGQ